MIQLFCLCAGGALAVVAWALVAECNWNGAAAAILAISAMAMWVEVDNKS